MKRNPIEKYDYLDLLMDENTLTTIAVGVKAMEGLPEFTRHTLELHGCIGGAEPEAMVVWKASIYKDPMTDASNLYFTIRDEHNPSYNLFVVVECGGAMTLHVDFNVLNHDPFWGKKEEQIKELQIRFDDAPHFVEEWIWNNDIRGDYPEMPEDLTDSVLHPRPERLPEYAARLMSAETMIVRFPAEGGVSDRTPVFQIKGFTELMAKERARSCP